VRAGDLVLAVDGAPVRSATQLRNRIGLTRVGETVEMTVERKGQQQMIRARIDEVEQTANQPSRRSGRVPRGAQ
jgi:serine protease DegQ